MSIDQNVAVEPPPPDPPTEPQLLTLDEFLQKLKDAASLPTDEKWNYLKKWRRESQEQYHSSSDEKEDYKNFIAKERA